MPDSDTLIIAIDGISGAGKSSTSKAVAEALGFRHLDTGAMYRAHTYLALRQGFSASDETALAALAARLDLSFAEDGRLFASGEDLSKAIRSPEVSRNVSDYCKAPKVRAILVALQRRLGSEQNTVVEGRDIGTVVFPDAALKLFMTARPEVRARRRQLELAAMGVEADYAGILQDLVERDAKDSSRAESPLRKAADAIEIDTSDLTPERQIAMIVDLVMRRTPEKSGV